MMRTLTISRLALAALLAAGDLHGPARAASPMPACPTSRVPPLVLPHVRAAVAANRQVLVVALGSSSTQGWHSTDIAHSYPAILQTLLNDALPTAHIAVINRGIGGQDAAEEVPRIARDVLDLHPDLVIWQVGANGAMKNISIDLFKRLLVDGIRQMKQSDTDVVLMDNQRAPAILASPGHVQIDQAMADVAVATGAGLFARGALMDQWRADGFPYDTFVSTDGVHHNDYGYRCISAALANAVVDGLAQQVPTQTAAKR